MYIGSLNATADERNTIFENPIYNAGLPDRETADSERNLENPIYGHEEERTVDGAYEAPHFDIQYSSI